ncbi:type I secretion system permease/ATPase [Limnohabitans sp. Hippo3]|uniref:type I secretion system permease/ATPase n=1 Tax=Limnohabitans sp. Hippo3 TaxID=1597956 RepID=UPI001304C058|nr:type I secretion system permease/ATPase [Limnohabitans sp. Hippo3]
MDQLAFSASDTHSANTASVTSPSPGSSIAPERDPLLVCLAMTAKRIDREVHLSALRAGFAVDEEGRIPMNAYPDLARLHGMIAVWSRTELRQIPSYVLPVIVPLVDGRAVVLVSVTGQTAQVLTAETGMSESAMSMDELQRLNYGEILVVKAATQKSTYQLVPFKGAALSWFWNTVWRYQGFYIESMMAAVVANVLTLAAVFFAMNVYDRVVPTQAYTSLWTLAIGTTVAILLEFGVRWLKARLVDLAGRKADLSLNAMLLREIMAIRLEHRPQSIGIFASSMRDFESLRDFMSSASMVMVVDMPFILLLLVLIGIIGGPIAWIPAAAVPILVIVGLWAQRPLMRAMRENMKESGDKQSVLVESLLNLEMLKAHNAESYLQRRWENANLAATDSYKQIRSLTNLMLGLTATLQQLVTVGMVVYGVYLIGDNTLTLGGLIASVILAGRAISPLGSIMALAARYQQARSSLDTLDALMKRPRDRDGERRYVVPERIAGSLSADALEFAYPGEHQIPVIRKLTLNLPAGQHLALLGRIGSGKSTLLRLLAGLYTPLGGRISIDGVDLQQLEPAEIRSRLGYVGQEAQLFQGSLRDNLVLSDSWISDARVIEVLQKLDMYTMVASHPRGLDMPLTEAGGGLSGGQRQMLAIARMMLRDPALVFLDEPTSMMDQTTEAKVIEVLGQWLQGRTLVLSTHRLQLLVWVERIALMENGQILLEGPREEVLRKLAVGVAPKSAAGTRTRAPNKSNTTAAAPVSPATPIAPTAPAAA